MHLRRREHNDLWWPSKYSSLNSIRIPWILEMEATLTWSLIHMICFVNLSPSCSYLLHVVRAVLASWGGSLVSLSSYFLGPLSPFPPWREVTISFTTCRGFNEIWGEANPPFGQNFVFLVWQSWRIFFLITKLASKRSACLWNSIALLLEP